MAALVISSFKNLPVFFNISAKVGRGCPNQPEDVELVTFLLKQMGGIITNPAGVAKIAAVRQGVADAALGACIDWFEVNYGCRPDGHISVATPNTTYVHNGPQAFMICRLNYFIGQANASVWPRIDKISDASPAIGALVARELLCT